MANIEEMRKDGVYESFTWPGGYPIYYITADGGVLCPKCANENYEQTCDPNDSQWFIIDCDVNWEDETLYCDHCNELVESAYGGND
jgi:hypothetical protein